MKRRPKPDFPSFRSGTPEDNPEGNFNPSLNVPGCIVRINLVSSLLKPFLVMNIPEFYLNFPDSRLSSNTADGSG